MNVRVLYFAHVRERLRLSEEVVAVTPGATVAELLDVLCARHDAVAAARGALRVAVNHDFEPVGHPLCDGDEVALIPPVSGGAPACRLSTEPLVLGEVIAAVSGPGRGGVVTFTGCVRDRTGDRAVVRLEYEAYGAMALRTLAALIDSIEAARPGVRLAVVHRLGVLAIGEAAVVVAAAAPHRADAFAACSEAIDRLKQEVPIWKKEVFEGGEAWVGDRP